MRGIKLIVLTGLILAITATAGAAGIPLRDSSWLGPVYMHINDLTQGRPYTGKLADGVTWATPGVWYEPDQLESYAPNGAKPGEDSWSIYQVDAIYKGFWYGANTIGPIDMANPLYIHGDSSTEVVGTYFNRSDLLVKINADGSFDYESAGDTHEIFAQPLGTYAAHDPGALELFGESGSSLRVVNDNGTPLDTTDDFYEDKYAGFGYDAAGNLIAGAERAFRMESVVGYFGDEIDLNPSHQLTEAVGHFAPDLAGGTGSGHGDSYTRVLLESEGDLVPPGWDPIANGPYFGYNDWNFADRSIFSPTKWWGGPDADLRIHVTSSPIGLRPTPDYDWLVQTSDPVTGHHMIPEPVTMLCVFLGVSSLGAYIRKRRLS